MSIIWSGQTVWSNRPQRAATHMPYFLLPFAPCRGQTLKTSELKPSGRTKHLLLVLLVVDLNLLLVCYWQDLNLHVTYRLWIFSEQSTINMLVNIDYYLNSILRKYCTAELRPANVLASTFTKFKFSLLTFTVAERIQTIHIYMVDVPRYRHTDCRYLYGTLHLLFYWWFFSSIIHGNF